MKKLVSLLLAVLLLIPCIGLAENYDAMTTEQLRTVIMEARAALAKKTEPFNGKCVVYDENGIKITITDVFNESYTTWICFGVTIVNKSNAPIRVMFDKSCINGWQMTTSDTVIDVAAGKNIRDKIYFMTPEKDADVSKPEDVEDLSFSIRIINTENYNTLFTVPEQTVDFTW